LTEYVCVCVCGGGGGGVRIIAAMADNWVGGLTQMRKHLFRPFLGCDNM
jgi:hypothetical protein